MLPENPRKKNKNRISGDIKRDATGISFLLEKDGEAVEEKKISVSLHENESYIRKRCENCDDILIRPMRLGEGHKVDCLMVYIEVAVSNMMLDDSAIGKMINHFWEIPEEKIREFIRRNSLGIADVEELFSMEEVFGAVLSGNAVFFMDGYDRAMKDIQQRLSGAGCIRSGNGKSAAGFQRRLLRQRKNQCGPCTEADPGYPP